jgi:hypothetical protein
MALGSPTLVPERPLPRPEPAIPTPEADEHPLEADRATEAALRSVAEEVDFLEEAEAPAPERTPTPTPTSAAPRPPKDPDLHEVEMMLAGGLETYYKQLAAKDQEAFRKKGEEISKELAGMVKRLSIDFKRALQLIRDWLLVIPGVSKFFLEQEAKIKVDMLKRLIDERKSSPS